MSTSMQKIFETEVIGRGMHIFRPALYSFDFPKEIPLLASPEKWIARYEKKLYSLLSYLVNPASIDVESRAREAYLKVIEGLVTGNIFGEIELSIVPFVGISKFEFHEYDPRLRAEGKDISGLGMTMIGQKRIHNLRELLRRVFQAHIPGDFLEAGVWRGGASIYASAVFRAYREDRSVFVCDSFAGLPPSSLPEDKKYGSWDNTSILEVSERQVIRNFQEFRLLDSRVVIVKGFFNVTMPVLRDISHTHLALSVLRLDGDMYESAVDVLYNLYERVSLGGYIIVDDWKGFPAKDACMDFFQVHNLKPTIQSIDESSVFWRKDSEVVVQYYRYKRKQFQL